MSALLTSIEAIVERAALELVHRHSLDEIEAVLSAEGVPTPLAGRLVLLIPSAFAAAHYEPQGILFPQQFLVGPSGDRRELDYALEPGYREARRLAEQWALQEKHSFVARVLDWSAEASAIKEAKARGLTPSKLSCVHHGDQW
jgi:hypothetical protein